MPKKVPDQCFFTRTTPNQPTDLYMVELKFLAYILLILLFTSCKETQEPITVKDTPPKEHTAHTHIKNASSTNSIPDHIDAQYLNFEYTIPYNNLQAKMDRRLSKKYTNRY